MSLAAAEGAAPAPMVVGRYVLHAPIARGGMATIHIARLTGAEGFTRIVAAKRLHPELLEDAEFVAMFLDEARIASRVNHPNVVPVLDVITTGSEIVLVQEYVHGVPLSCLLRAARRDGVVPAAMIVTILAGVLAGLHGAHEARDELGVPLDIVHRDVSPQNVMVTLDGTPRLLDFGVAKATLSSHVTQQGAFKGKIAYMAPEQLKGKATRASDLYAVGVMLWEALVGERLHQGITEAAMLTNILRCDAPLITVALADRRAEIPAVRWEQMLALEPLIDRALAREPTDRFATAAGMEEALLEAVPRLSAAEVGAWTRELGKDFLVGRNALLAHEEVSWRRRHGNLESGTRIIVGQPAELPAVQADVITVASDAGGASCASGALPVVELPRRRPPPWFWGGLLLLGATCVSSVFAIDRHVSQALPGATPSALSPAVLPESPVLPSAEASQVVPQTPSVEPIRILVPRAALTRGRAVAPAAPRRTPSEQAGGTLSSPAAPVDLDCVPPFYFEGKKKLYKPGCI